MTMTADIGGQTPRKLDTGKQRRARITGFILIALAVLVGFIFALDSVGNATFRLSRPTDPWVVPNLVVPAMSFNYIAAAILAFLGARQFLRGGVRWTSLSLGFGLLVAIAAFLVWATAGKSFSLTGMFSATVVRAVPIALGGLAGVLSERVAVVWDPTAKPMLPLLTCLWDCRLREWKLRESIFGQQRACPRCWWCAHGQSVKLSRGQPV